MFGLWYDHKLSNPFPPADAPLMGAVATASMLSFMFMEENIPAGGLQMTLVTEAEMFKTCRRLDGFVFAPLLDLEDTVPCVIAECPIPNDIPTRAIVSSLMLNFESLDPSDTEDPMLHEFAVLLPRPE